MASGVIPVEYGRIGISVGSVTSSQSRTITHSAACRYFLALSSSNVNGQGLWLVYGSSTSVIVTPITTGSRLSYSVSGNAITISASSGTTYPYLIPFNTQTVEYCSFQ